MRVKQSKIALMLQYIYLLLYRIIDRMKITQTIKELQEALLLLKKEGDLVGFVPTMGALHAGHISLVDECKATSEICVVSIFVNPTQFNNKQDLIKYPRMPEKDLDMLKNAGVDLVFMPSVEEMYPKTDTRIFNFGTLETVMEGVHRPGHFNGVAQIVSKLFDAVQPDKAYFGEKDFQQLAIIKAMTKKEKYNIEIIPCATVREDDGLAMSSRNLLLTKTNRLAAPKIHQLLKNSVALMKSQSVEIVKNEICNQLNAIDGFKTEYFEIVNADTLQPITEWEEEGSKVGCVAVYAGEIRLIDNIRYQ